MLVSDLFSETYSAIAINKTRSFLTILGIVIGIGSVIAMISIGNGARQSIQNQIQSIGSNLLMIQPGFQRSPGMQASQGRGSARTLTIDDADAIKKDISTVEAVAPVISGNYQVIANGQNTRTSVMGTVAAYASVNNIKMSSGVFITDQQNRKMAKVAVIGPTARDDLFGENIDAIGQKARINGIDFTVVGITEAKGGSGFMSSDDIIYIPLLTAKQYLAGDDTLSQINLTIAKQEEMELAEKQVSSLLLARHGIADEADADFRIMNQADIIETASSIAETFTLLLGAVAGISLVVGGIGIMNMMLTTVTERTREIGLRKAIGAKRKDITNQFLAEAVALTFLGGIVGVILGGAISLGVEKYGGLTTEVTTFSIILAFGVSAAIGIIFGYYPARRAAKLSPIKALRYE